MDPVVRGVKQMSVDDDGVDQDEMESLPDSPIHMISDDPIQPELDSSDLPNVLIIANIHDSVFDNIQVKAHFEAVFRDCDPQSEIQYLKSFRRARIAFTTPLLAAQAKIQLHEAEICGRRIKVYFAMPLETTISSTPHLEPPKPDKQFLISPPASPPVGWESCPEAVPIINYDLLHALAQLKPGEAHEVHPPTDSNPSIVVHICEDPEGFSDRGKIVQTRCPDRNS